MFFAKKNRSGGNFGRKIPNPDTADNIFSENPKLFKFQKVPSYEYFQSYGQHRLLPFLACFNHLEFFFVKLTRFLSPDFGY